MSGDNRVALMTYDPRSGGGVRSVMEFAYETVANAGLDPYLVYNALQWSDCLTLRDLVRSDWRIPVTEEWHDGMEGIQIGRGFPELLVTNYLVNRNEWQAALDSADATLVLGGHCLAGIPAARKGDRYAVWMGTTIEDEREVQIRYFGLGRRLRYEVARPILRHQERLVLLNAEQVLVQSTYTKRQVVQRHGLDPDEVEVLPYPVDTEKFSPGKPETDPHEIVFVGRINDPRKNIELLLKSFARVVETIPEAHLTLVGGEPDDWCVGLMEKLGIRENVAIPGEVKSVVPYLRRAAMFAFPSRQEGFGISALEAMACGTPVVSTRCGGPEDFVKNGKTGYLVDEGNVLEFSKRMIDILQDPAQCSRFSEESRRLTRRKYDVDLITQQFVEQLRQLRLGQDTQTISSNS